MPKPRWRGSSRREQIQGVNDTFRANAIMRGGTPEQMAIAEKMCTPLAPKRDRIKRPVDGRPVHRSEHQEQAAVISWWGVARLQYELPSFALFAVPNGGARDFITGARLKAEGVRRGVFDLILAKPAGAYHGLYLELKVGSNKPSPEQEAFKQYLESVGYCASVHWGADSAIAAIEDYLK